MIRSTQNMTARQTLYNLNRVTEDLTRAQRQLSTGKQIERPEDDPFGTGRALYLRGELSDIDSYKNTIEESVSWLNTADTALTNVEGVTQRVRELMIQATNGTQDQGALDAIGAEIKQLKESMREQANANFAGRYIFSGTATTTKPYPAGANAYQGNNLSVQRLIAPGQTMTVNQLGTDIFGPDGSNFFDVLDTIQADLSSGDRNALQTDLAKVDTAFDRIQTAQANVGAITNRLKTQSSHLDDQEINVKSLLSDREDADMAKTIVNFSQTQAIYQSALQAGAKVIQPSLLDFLS
jgi:flagellar hook-associated protein 3 FlgL